MSPEMLNTAASVGIGGFLAVVLAWVVVAESRRRRSSPDMSEAIVEALKRQAEATERLTTTLSMIMSELQQHSEALRRLEVGQAQLLSKHDR